MIQALLDSSPPGMDEKVRAAVAAMDGVFDCHAVRVRHSGPSYFVDLHITVDGEQSLRAAHALTERVEQAVEAILPGVDVTVHPEPAPTISANSCNPCLTAPTLPPAPGSDAPG